MREQRSPLLADGAARMWARAVRPFSLTASAVPVLLGAAVAETQGLIDPALLLLTLVAAAAMQGAANLFREYFDNRSGCGVTGSDGSPLVQGVLQPGEVFLAGLVLLLLSAAIIVYLAALKGTPVLVPGVLGVLGAYCYALRPVTYPSRALGGSVTLLLFGPLVALGAYYVQVQAVELTPALYALPIGCLVLAVHHASNLQAVPDAGRGAALTEPRPVESRGSKVLLYGPPIAAYALVIIGVLAGAFVRWSALVLLSVPLAWALVLQVRNAEGTRDLALLDGAIVRLYLVFGVLLIVGVLL